METILLKLASTVLVLEEHHTFVNCFMARYFVAIEILKKLALALEEGNTVDEPDPNINIDLHSLLLMDREENLLLMHLILKVLFTKLQVTHLFYFYSKFKITIAF